MADIKWTEKRPRDEDRVRDLSELWPSSKTAFKDAFEDHFYFTDSTASAGLPRYSTDTPGSARFYYGARSAVSDPGRSGSAMILSDESRIIYFDGSGESFWAGGQREVAHLAESYSISRLGMRPSMKQVIIAQDTTVSAGPNVITYPAAFRGLFTGAAEEFVDVMVTSISGANSAASYMLAIHSVSTTTFDCSVRYIGPLADPDEGQITYIAIGRTRF